MNHSLGLRRISAADNDAKQRQEAFLKTSRTQLRDKILDIDSHISDLIQHIQTYHPQVLKTNRTLTEVQMERDLLLETVKTLLQKADPNLRRRTLRQLTKKSEKAPHLLAEFENLQNS